MKDQATGLRDLSGKVNEGHKVSTPSTKSIAVVSGKGGVGKTNLTLNLAISLAEAGKKVLIFDADLGMANIDILMGVIPKFTLYDVLQGKVCLEEIIVHGEHGIKILPGGSAIGEISSFGFQQKEIIWRQLNRLCDNLDYLLIDCGSGISRSIVAFMVAVDEIIVVLTPEPTAIADAYSVIKILSKYEINSEVLLVINKVRTFNEADETAKKIEVVCEKFLKIDIKRLGHISNDKAIENAISKQIPFMTLYPNSKAAVNLRQIADNLLAGTTRPPKGTADFVKKLFRLF